VTRGQLPEGRVARPERRWDCRRGTLKFNKDSEHKTFIYSTIHSKARNDNAENLNEQPTQ